jgi:hypothetical protein
MQMKCLKEGAVDSFFECRRKWLKTATVIGM